ncbi:hypothetical protein GCM10023321_84850 [Pseudonocardia eucalypti]|uniref:Uncharacterized protein n=1 Tax=Pseudonocardia eucalypti TaxID=648755 RepID=A0ABP9RFE9_9PSEU|nr:hypothetical protein [Pseudonocardia eucalypti]
MLSDPRPALTEQSDFHHLLVGLAGLGELVRALAGPPGGPSGTAEADELVHVLLGLVSLGDAVGGMAAAPVPAPAPPPDGPAELVRWLR